MKFPYDDEFLVYNYQAHRYEPTIAYANYRGIALEERVKGDGAPNAQAIMNEILRTASVQVYSYIYKHCAQRKAMQFAIAKSESARSALLEAMGEQLVYLSSVGNAGRSMDKNEREVYLDIMAKSILDDAEIPEFGIRLITAIPLRFYPPDYTEGNY